VVWLENENWLEVSIRCRFRALCSGSAASNKYGNGDEVGNLAKIVKDNANERMSAPGIDEGKRSALDPCSSSDLVRVAGTRLVDGELMVNV
jgi:hypothetical protein